MKNIKYLVVLGVILLTGCTENQRARKFGGEYTETLPSGQKLVNATWKQNDLWILTKPMSSNDAAETYSFIEKSSFGIMEGKVIIQESK
jgi:hypothetical protein